MDLQTLMQAIQQQIVGGGGYAQGGGIMRKDWASPTDAVSGIAGYSLEAPAKLLIPVITPIRNMLPRVNATGGVQANWRAVTAINTGNTGIGLAEGVRGGVAATTVTPYSAAFVELGLEDFVTWKADLASMNFQDVKALATQLLLWNLMIQEEHVHLGGNTSYAMGTTATPAAAGSNSGGSLGSATYSVICVALSYDAYRVSTIAGGVPVTVARTNIDGTTTTYNAGACQKSAAASSGAITGPNGSITCSVATKNGAVAYAWYWGTAGNEVLGAITTINSIVITAAAAGTQNASVHSSDHSQNAYVHDGFLTFAAKTGTGGYVVQQATGTAGTGTPLTADGKGGCVQIDADLRYFWDNLRLSPDTIWVSSQEQLNLSAIVLGGSSLGAQRFVIDAKQGALAGGMMVVSYLNKFSMAGAKQIDIKLHPTLPPGTILYTTSQLPYPLSNVQQVARVLCRRDYNQIEWPIRTRRYEYGIYSDQVLQHYFPPSVGMRSNIANGVG